MLICWLQVLGSRPFCAGMCPPAWYESNRANVDDWNRSLQRFSALSRVSLTCAVLLLSQAFSSGACYMRNSNGMSWLIQLYGRFKSDTTKTSSWMYLNKDQLPSPWATSMVIQVRALSLATFLWYEADTNHLVSSTTENAAV
jgi:hypothetical protein